MQVLDDDRKTYEVKGRAAAIVRAVARAAGRINAPAQLRLEFNCSGRKVRVSRTEFVDEEVRG